MSLQQALHDCIKWHGSQTRKYTGLPYYTHPLEVMCILIDHGITNEEMLIAALFHDIVEDTDVTLLTIANKYGINVARMVDDLTDDKTPGNRAARKAHDCARLAKVSSYAKTIKCADLISNTRDITAHDKDFAKVYLKEKENVLQSLEDGAHQYLYASTVEALRVAKAAIYP